MVRRQQISARKVTQREREREREREIACMRACVRVCVSDYYMRQNFLFLDS